MWMPAESKKASAVCSEDPPHPPLPSRRHAGSWNDEREIQGSPVGGDDCASAIISPGDPVASGLNRQFGRVLLRRG